jgi:hypothetical protein
MISLPIDEVLPALREALATRHEAVLEAPPGAGKTTRVPLALLNEPWLAGQTILMLEPRRLAARAAAERLASELGEKVGETVGYRIRLDSKVGPNTRIEVVTEGILTRRLQDDPALEGVGLLIFDEFHVLPFAPKFDAFLSKITHFLCSFPLQPKSASCIWTFDPGLHFLDLPSYLSMLHIGPISARCNAEMPATRPITKIPPAAAAIRFGVAALGAGFGRAG